MPAYVYFYVSTLYNKKNHINYYFNIYYSYSSFYLLACLLLSCLPSFSFSFYS